MGLNSISTTSKKHIRHTPSPVGVGWEVLGDERTVDSLSSRTPRTHFMSNKLCNVQIVNSSNKSNKLCNMRIVNSSNWSNKFFNVQITFFMSKKMCNVKIIFSMSNKLFNKGITFFMTNKMCNVCIVIGSDLSVMFSVDRLMILRAHKSTGRIWRTNYIFISC